MDYFVIWSVLLATAVSASLSVALGQLLAIRRLASLSLSLLLGCCFFANILLSGHSPTMTLMAFTLGIETGIVLWTLISPKKSGRATIRELLFALIFSIGIVVTQAMTGRAAAQAWSDSSRDGLYILFFLSVLFGLVVAKQAYKSMATIARENSDGYSGGQHRTLATAFIVIAILTALARSLLLLGLPFGLKRLDDHDRVALGWANIWTLLFAATLALSAVIYAWIVRPRNSPDESLRLSKPAVGLATIASFVIIVTTGHDLLAGSNLSLLPALYLLVLSCLAGVMYSEDLIETHVYAQLLRAPWYGWILIVACGLSVTLGMQCMVDKMWAESANGLGIQLQSALLVLGLMCLVLLIAALTGMVVALASDRENQQLTGVSTVNAHLQVQASYTVILIVALWAPSFVLPRLSSDLLQNLQFFFAASIATYFIYQAYLHTVDDHQGYLRWERIRPHPPSLLLRSRDSADANARWVIYLAIMERHIDHQHKLVRTLGIVSPIGILMILGIGYTSLQRLFTAR